MGSSNNVVNKVVKVGIIISSISKFVVAETREEMKRMNKELNNIDIV